MPTAYELELEIRKNSVFLFSSANSTLLSTTDFPTPLGTFQICFLLDGKPYSPPPPMTLFDFIPLQKLELLDPPVEGYSIEIPPYVTVDYSVTHKVLLTASAPRSEDGMSGVKALAESTRFLLRGKIGVLEEYAEKLTGEMNCSCPILEHVAPVFSEEELERCRKECLQWKGSRRSAWEDWTCSDGASEQIRLCRQWTMREERDWLNIVINRNAGRPNILNSGVLF